MSDRSELWGNYDPFVRKTPGEERYPTREGLSALVRVEQLERRGSFNPTAPIFPMRGDAPAPHKRAGTPCPRCRGSILGDSCLNCGWEYAPEPLPLVDYTGRERQVHRRTNEAR